MARTKDPYADPVTIYRKGNLWRVRYYPTGFITAPSDRRELPRGYATSELALQAAAMVRDGLMEHRSLYGPGSRKVDAPLADALSLYIAELNSGRESKAVPDGTAVKRISDVRLALKNLCQSRDFRVSQLAGDTAKSIIAEFATRKGRWGGPASDNTLRGWKVSLKNFGTWLVTHDYLDTNPFGFLDADTEDSRISRRAEQRTRALSMVNNDVFAIDGDGDRGIGLEDVPTLQIVSAFSEAIRIVESRSTDLIVFHSKKLDADTAWQTSQQPMLEVASGLRLNELLGVHTSRVDLDTLTIGVDRQLDPRHIWIPGQAPPLMPPKHNKSRLASVWPVFGENLERLIAHADRHTGGWLFPSTGRQRWRTKARETEWQRAIRYQSAARLAAINAGVPEDELPTVWTYTPHYTRHTYGSYSLAPVESGGLGWSVLTVKESMGHQSELTTIEIYRHVTSEGRARVRSILIAWPGLT